MNFNELSTQVKLATIKVLDTLGLYGTIGYADSCEDISELFNKDILTINDCRNGREVVWYFDADAKECCVYIDTLEELNETEIKDQLL